MTYRLPTITRMYLVPSIIIVGALSVFGILFSPGEASAAIVQCGFDSSILSDGSNGGLCQWCDLFLLANKAINNLTVFLSGVLAIIIAIAGFKMITSQGNVGQAQAARTMISNGIIGFVIVLSAWLIVNTVLTKLTNGGGIGNFGVACTTAPVVSSSGGSGSSSGLPSGCFECSDMPSDIPTNGNACSVKTPCQMNATMAERLRASGVINGNSDGLRVSEAWPPEGHTAGDPSGIHGAACHGTATCVDVSFEGGNPQSSQISRFINSASSHGLTAVYEVPDQDRANELRSSGINALVVPRVPKIKEHFSVYMCDIDSSPNACRN